MPGQTVQTQIKLLLEEQSDQGLHRLPFRLHLLASLLYDRAIVQILEWLQQIFWVSEYLGNLRYTLMKNIAFVTLFSFWIHVMVLEKINMYMVLVWQMW